MTRQETLSKLVAERRHGLEREDHSRRMVEEIVEQKSELAKKLYSQARLHRLFGEHEKAVPLIKEAQELVGHNLESDFFLADNLVAMGKGDEAYEILRPHRYLIFEKTSHPLRSLSSRLVDDLRQGLYHRCMDNCERLLRPVDIGEFKDWKLENRFKDVQELEEVVKRYHPSGKLIDVVFHPFTYIQTTRKIGFQGLTCKGVPFRIEGDFAEGTSIVQVKNLICIPESNDGVNSGIYFLETEIKGRT